MAGSYKHCVADDGQLYAPRDLRAMVENDGDVYEAIEEVYGMIWLLATRASLHSPRSAASIVEGAREHYKDGLALSPGTKGRLPEEED